MRGKLGLVERFVKPPSITVVSTTSNATAVGDGTQESPMEVALSGNAGISRQVTLKASVAGTLRFSMTAPDIDLFGLNVNDVEQFYIFSNSVTDADFSPISISVDDEIAFYDYGGAYISLQTASVWIDES